MQTREYKWGKYHCTIDLLFDWFGISCMTTDNFCFYLQNSLIQTSQTGGQWYSDTSPFSIPCANKSVVEQYFMKMVGSIFRKFSFLRASEWLIEMMSSFIHSSQSILIMKDETVMLKTSIPLNRRINEQQ